MCINYLILQVKLFNIKC